MRNDAIIATGRSDYPNQINNVLGFPYIFRGALDVRARTINEEMKVAAAQALAQLAREDVPDEVAAAYAGARPEVRARLHHPRPVRSAADLVRAALRRAGGDGHRRRAQADRRHGRLSRSAWRSGSIRRRRSCSASRAPCARDPKRKRIVFAEGEEPAVIRAALRSRRRNWASRSWSAARSRSRATCSWSALPTSDITIINARSSEHNAEYTDFLYKRLQRYGYLQRDAQRLVNQDRNVFAACMVALGHADGMVTGVTRNYATSLSDILLAIDQRKDVRPIGMSIVIGKAGPMLIADTSVTEMPGAQELAEIAISAAEARSSSASRRSWPSFRTPRSAIRRASAWRRCATRSRSSTRRGQVGFEYDGEMAVDVALNPDARRLYPFSRLIRARQRAGDAGDPLGLDLDQDGGGARRRDGDRSAAGRPQVLGADRPARCDRRRTSSTWRRSRLTIRWTDRARAPGDSAAEATRSCLIQAFGGVWGVLYGTTRTRPRIGSETRERVP